VILTLASGLNLGLLVLGKRQCVGRDENKNLR